MAATVRRWPRRLAIGLLVVVALLGGLWLAFRVDDIPVATLRNWEQNRFTMEPAAQTLLKLVDREPDAALRALGPQAA